jgi:magnesium-transporting ATPase (P-type)
MCPRTTQATTDWSVVLGMRGGGRLGWRPGRWATKTKNPTLVDSTTTETTTTALAESLMPASQQDGSSESLDVSPLPPLSYNASAVDAGVLSMADLWDTLQSSPAGLCVDEAHRRWLQYGPNALQKPPTKSLLALIAEQFQDRLVQILLVVAVLSALFSVAEVTTSSSAATAPVLETNAAVALPQRLLHRLQQPRCCYTSPCPSWPRRPRIP